MNHVWAQEPVGKTAGRGIKLAAQRHKLFIEKSLTRVVPGERTSKWCTMHVEGQTRNSRRFSRDGGCWRGWGSGGFFKSKDQMRPIFPASEIERVRRCTNSSSGSLKGKQKRKKKKEKPRAYLKTVGWVCFEDLSTPPDAEITGRKRRLGEGVRQGKGKECVKDKVMSDQRSSIQNIIAPEPVQKPAVAKRT